MPSKILTKMFALGKMGLLNWLSDETYLKLMYWSLMGKRLNLVSPVTFNEKLQWLKLHDRNPLYTTLVDKSAAKKYVSDKIGSEHIIPTLGEWEEFDDIDFDSLPNQFVLKCTHDSGGLVICKDKVQLNREKAKKKIERSLERDYYWAGREWPYKNVPHKIIAEKFMSDSAGIESQLTDYKFFCFGGEVDSVMLCMDRESGDTKYYFFSPNWNLMRLNKRGMAAPEGFTLPRPECFDEMLEIAKKLSQGLPFARVDLYQCDRKVYFGEITFFPDSGFDANILPETDLYWGQKLRIKDF